MIKKQGEKFIEDSILDYLALHDIFAWKIKSVGTFDPIKKKFRTPSKRYKKGVSDILGIYRSRPLAIEVKSKKGRLNPHQESFLTEFGKRGGCIIVARSIEDVEKGLNLFDQLIKAREDVIKSMTLVGETALKVSSAPEETLLMKLEKPIRRKARGTEPQGCA